MHDKCIICIDDSGIVICRRASDGAFDQSANTSLSMHLLPDVDSATCLDLQALEVQETRKMKDDTKIHHIVDDLVSRPRKLVGLPSGRFYKTVNDYNYHGHVYIPLPSDSVSAGIMFSACLFHPFIHSSVRSFVRTDKDIVTAISQEGWSSVDKTDREYSLVPTDELIRFWRLNVKVLAGCRGVEDIHFNVGLLKSIFYLLYSLFFLSEVCFTALFSVLVLR